MILSSWAFVTELTGTVSRRKSVVAKTLGPEILQFDRKNLFAVKRKSARETRADWDLVIEIYSLWRRVLTFWDMATRIASANTSFVSGEAVERKSSKQAAAACLT